MEPAQTESSVRIIIVIKIGIRADAEKMEKNKKAAKEDPKTVNKPYKPNYDKKAQINNEVSGRRNDAKQSNI